MIRKCAGLLITAAALLVPSVALAEIQLPPGAINPDVTQENIGSTICAAGWTKTIRPPAAYTTKLKIQQLRAEGVTGRASDYEEDHLIPLELGGHPTDESNLWPEPWNGPNGAHAKDRVENKLHRKVCNGQISLQDAQQQMLIWAKQHPPE